MGAMLRTVRHRVANSHSPRVLLIGSISPLLKSSSEARLRSWLLPSSFSPLRLRLITRPHLFDFKHVLVFYLFELHRPLMLSFFRIRRQLMIHDLLLAF